MNKEKVVSDSVVTMTELILPQHTNQLGNLLGGQLMHWIDICAAMSAAKHAQMVCVTASVDKIDFHHPNKLGEIISLTAKVNRAFNTSMEVGVEVFNEAYKDGSRKHTNTAYLTFVAVNAEGKPVRIPPVVPETDDEKQKYDEALQRRELRLRDRKNA